ncbi:tetratricopeptide repeat protein [Sphingomonas sp. LT1P40]|uniref:tetratricopeptide repeat protein n=1 Tax=Alteristakelama amylovorans TaxID=3096166 RepID=UPI002FCB5C7E
MLSLLLFFAVQADSAAQSYSPAVKTLIADHARLAPGELAKRLAALADRGDLSAAQALGEMAQQGALGVPRNLPMACDWYERGSALRGDSTHNLALCFETGNGRPQDMVRARTLYQAAAAKGWVQAKCALGTMLVAGRGGAVDAARGVALCREAAEAGNANAQTDYGGFLLTGKGIARDPVEARKWLTAAAERKQANAAFLLAQIHMKGDGTPRDPAQAERWWRVAYEGGRADAAIHVSNAIYARIAPDGETIADRSLIPEWMRWVRIAATEEPDPALRAKWQEMLRSLEKGD